MGPSEDLGPLPDRVALVFGTESVGVTNTFLENADRRVYLPLHGFADSLNVSVSVALILQRIFELATSSPRGSCLGDMESAERQCLREAWYSTLARSEKEHEEYKEIAMSGGVAPLRDMRR